MSPIVKQFLALKLANTGENLEEVYNCLIYVVEHLEGIPVSTSAKEVIEEGARFPLASLGTSGKTMYDLMSLAADRYFCITIDNYLKEWDKGERVELRKALEYYINDLNGVVINTASPSQALTYAIRHPKKPLGDLMGLPVTIKELMSLAERQVFIAPHIINLGEESEDVTASVEILTKDGNTIDYTIVNSLSEFEESEIEIRYMDEVTGEKRTAVIMKDTILGYTLSNSLREEED